MKELSKTAIKNGDGFASSNLREDLLKIESDIFINFSYTDYGGDFFDRVCCKYFSENYPKNFISKSTSWFGENGYLFGDVAKQFLEDSENYLLGFEDLEDFYYSELNLAEVESFQNFLEDIKADYIIKDTALDYLITEKSGYYSILSSGCLDFCYSDLEQFLLDNNQIIKIEE